MKAMAEMSDSDLGKHLTEEHAYSAMAFVGRLYNRDCWEAYHYHLHKSPCGHEHDGGNPMPAGPSIFEKSWEELDAVMERLMAQRLYGAGEAEDGRDPGRAEGMAMIIAIFTNPYMPDIEAVRAEAMRRWEEQHGPNGEG